MIRHLPFFGFVIAVALVSGCTTAQLAKQAVASYCDTAPPYRIATRSAVNTAVAPNSIRIDCAADGGAQ
jgi:hypothetical protein